MLVRSFAFRRRGASRTICTWRSATGAPPVEVLSRFVETELPRLEALNEPDDAAGEVEELNGFFCRLRARCSRGGKAPSSRFSARRAQWGS